MGYKTTKMENALVEPQDLFVCITFCQQTMGPSAVRGSKIHGYWSCEDKIYRSADAMKRWKKRAGIIGSPAEKMIYHARRDNYGITRVIHVWYRLPLSDEGREKIKRRVARLTAINQEVERRFDANETLSFKK